jgi:NAD(P)-dependent dehydrogenase (short-subunit alcohol dehydrogenase family)
VTGAGRGLGRALVDQLARSNWSVVACLRSPAGVPFAPNVTVVSQDVRHPASDELRQAVADRPVDVLINNAGTGAPRAPLDQADPAAVLNALDVNAVGPLRLAQALQPNLLAAADPIIVNVTSRLGSLADQAAGRYADLDTSYAYRISKAAQNMLTIALAQEFAGRIRCWAVHPGTLATGLGRSGATTSPEQAAAWLVQLLDSPDPASPRYLSFPGTTLPW